MKSLRVYVSEKEKEEIRRIAYIVNASQSEVSRKLIKKMLKILEGKDDSFLRKLLSGDD